MREPTIQFEIPNLHLVSEANLAAHEHWRVTAERRRRHKRTALGWTVAEWQATLPSLRPRPPWTVSLTRIAPRPIDEGNLEVAFKGVQDGVAAALGVDDRMIRWRYAQKPGKPREYCVRIEIKELHT